MNHQLKWRKSSYSGQTGGDCVEMAQDSDGLVHVRDSKDPAGPRFSFGASEWASFVTAASRNEFRED